MARKQETQAALLDGPAPERSDPRDVRTGDPIIVRHEGLDLAGAVLRVHDAQGDAPPAVDASYYVGREPAVAARLPYGAGLDDHWSLEGDEPAEPEDAPRAGGRPIRVGDAVVVVVEETDLLSGERLRTAYRGRVRRTYGRDDVHAAWFLEDVPPPPGVEEVPTGSDRLRYDATGGRRSWSWPSDGLLGKEFPPIAWEGPKHPCPACYTPVAVMSRATVQVTGPALVRTFEFCCEGCVAKVLAVLTPPAEAAAP